MSFVDSILIAVGLFTIAIVMLCVVVAYNMFVPTLESDYGLDADLSDKVETGINMFDAMFLFLLFGFNFSLIVTGLFIRSHPVFFAINLLIVIALGIVAPVLSNAFYEVCNASTEFSTVCSSMPLTYAALENLPVISILFALIGGAVAVGKAYI